MKEFGIIINLNFVELVEFRMIIIRIIIRSHNLWGKNNDIAKNIHSV